MKNDKKDRRKEVISRGVFLNDGGQVLLVKPHGGNHWLSPGGRLEFGESPRDGFKREVMEEIGLNWKKFKLRVVDFSSKHYDGNGTICFVFYCGVISDNQIKKITLQDNEIAESGFFSLKDASKIMSKKGYKRLKESILANKYDELFYLEDGEKVVPAP